MMRHIWDVLSDSAAHYSLYQLLLFFVIYSVGGWCLEVAYHVVTTGKFVNRGFLNGPYCPIYGFGMICVIALLLPFRERPLLLFSGSVALTTVLEFLTGFVLEKVFHDKWWDYSKEPFNVKGYICLKFSLQWGFACMMAVDIIHVFFEKLVVVLPFAAGVFFLSASLAVMFADTVITILSIRMLHVKLRGMDEIARGIRALSDNLGENICEVTVKGMELSGEARENISEKYKELGQMASEKCEELGQKMGEKYEQLGRRVEEARQQIGQRMEEAHEQIGQRMEEAHEQIGQMAEEVYEQIGQRMEEAHEQIGQRVEEAHEQIGQMAEGAHAKLERKKKTVRLEYERKQGIREIEQAYKRTQRKHFLSEGEKAAYDDLMGKLKKMTEEYSFGQKRLMRAFPNLQERYNQKLDKMKKLFKERVHEDSQ